MRIIDTRIETMQIELLEASKEIKRCANCYSGRLLLDTLGGRFDTYTNPEEALANKAQMIRDVMDEEDSECDGSTCIRVSVVVDVFKRDNDEARFSPCDENEVSDAIDYYYKARKEADANKQEENVLTFDDVKFKLDYFSLRNAATVKPETNRTVIVLTDNACWFAGKYEDGMWKFKDGSVFDPEVSAGDIVAWFYVPTLHKLQ